MTFRGIVLRMQAHALARRSPTLRAQLRLARADGWKVKLGAPGGGQYVDAARRRIVLDGKPADVFQQTEMLQREGLDVPTTTALLQELRDAGLDVPTDKLTIDSCAAAIADALK